MSKFLAKKKTVYSWSRHIYFVRTGGGGAVEEERRRRKRIELGVTFFVLFFRIVRKESKNSKKMDFFLFCV